MATNKNPATKHKKQRKRTSNDNVHWACVRTERNCPINVCVVFFLFRIKLIAQNAAFMMMMAR